MKQHMITIQFYVLYRHICIFKRTIKCFRRGCLGLHFMFPNGMFLLFHLFRESYVIARKSMSKFSTWISQRSFVPCSSAQMRIAIIIRCDLGIFERRKKNFKKSINQTQNLKQEEINIRKISFKD